MPFTPQPDDYKYLARTVKQADQPVLSRTRGRKRELEEHITQQRQFEKFKQTQTYKDHLARTGRNSLARVQQSRTPTPKQESPTNKRKL
jgi:hypothetical protein